jgi:hypothetical protein
MNYKNWGHAIMAVLIFVSGCAKRLAVEYGDVEKTNSVDIRLVSGKKVSGIVEQVEPHQLTVLQKNETMRVIAKPTIDEIKRTPPIVDDFGNGISEREIQLVKKNSNALVYGIGGGLLSFGTSFFVGSLAGKNSLPVWVSATAGGGLLGTVLFTSAGRARDRRIAIETIQEARRAVQIKPENTGQKSDEVIKKMLEEEKEKQRVLREEREKLLKELEKQKK